MKILSLPKDKFYISVIFNIRQVLYLDYRFIFISEFDSCPSTNNKLKKT